MSSTHFPILCACARLVLEPRDVDRIVLPTLADELAEHGPHPQRIDQVRLSLRVVSIVIAVSAHRVLDGARCTTWWPLGVACIAGFAGSVGLRHASVRPTMSLTHLGFIAVGVLAACAIILLPPRWFRFGGGAASAAAAVALCVVPWVGQSFDGAQRWLVVGPLTIHVAVLVLPVLCEWMAALARSRRLLVHVGGLAAVLIVLCAQPNAPAVAIVSLVALAVCRQPLRFFAVLAVSVAAFAFVLTHSPSVAPAPHAEGALALLAQQGAGWLAVGLGAVAATLGACIHAWAATFRRPSARARRIEPRLAAAATGIAGLAMIPCLLGDGGVPWISYGGSAVIAAFALVGLSLRMRRIARDGSNPVAGVITPT